MTTVPALTVATRLVAKHSQPPWWSLLTGCSRRDPLASTEYSEWGEGPIFDEQWQTLQHGNNNMAYVTGASTQDTGTSRIPCSMLWLERGLHCFHRELSNLCPPPGDTQAEEAPWKMEGPEWKIRRKVRTFLPLAQTYSIYIKHLCWGAYLQNDLSGFRLPHGTITVICCTCVHAHSIIIGCCYKNRALRVDYPSRVLKENITQNDIHGKYAACDIFSI